jgi:hypothetical protein
MICQINVEIIVWYFVMQCVKKKNRTNYESFLNNFFDISVENREKLSLEYFSLITNINHL